MKYSAAKTLSIVCLVVVIIMHIPNWIVFGGESSATEKLLRTLDYYTQTIFEEGDLEWAQAQLDEVDSGLEIEIFISDMGNMLNPIKDMGASPVDFLSITNGYMGVVEFMTSPSLLEVIGDNLTENDPNTEMGLNIIRVILIIEVVLLIVTIVATIIQIICHSINRKSLGISVPIIIFINSLYMAVIWLFVDALFSDLTGGKVTFALWPWVALACSIFACVFWAKAREEWNASVE